MSRRFTILIAAAALTTAGGSAASTASAAVLGPSTGVTATRDGAKLDVTFTPAALAASRLKNGTSVDASCQHAATPSLLLADDADASSNDQGYASGKVGPDGVAHLTVQGLNGQPGALDYCEIDRLRHVSANSTVSNIVANVSLTPAGAVWVDEIEHAVALRHTLIGAHGATGYQPVAALGAGVVAMESPDATPPAGRIGYWTDGTHASVATLSAAGRRLVIEDRGNLVLRTNVLEQMDPLGVGDFTGSSETASGSGASEKKDPEADGSASPYKAAKPMLSADGVQAARSGRRLTVRFTGKSASAFRAIAGRRVAVLCAVVPPPRLFPDLALQASRAQYAEGYARVARHGGAVTVSLRQGRGDICYVVDEDTLVALTGATPAGRRYLQDLEALAKGGGLHFAAAGAKSYRTTAQILAHHTGPYVAMSGPDGAVAPGKVGVWTDGGQRAALVVRSASGTRFMTVDEGDGIGRTNILSLFSGPFLGVAFELGAADID